MSTEKEREIHDAYSAAVMGAVRAADTGQPLTAVTVRVLGTDRSTFTNSDGRFRIIRLQPGALSLTFEALGYQSRVLEVELAPGETRTLDITLVAAPLAVEGEGWPEMVRLRDRARTTIVRQVGDLPPAAATAAALICLHAYMITPQHKRPSIESRAC